MLKLTEGFDLNKNAVYERVGKSAGWLEWLCQNFCRQSGIISERPEWLKGRRVCMTDATDEGIKGSKGSDYRLHCMLELFTLETIELELTKIAQGETLRNYEKIVQDDIIMGDRAYGTIASMEYVQSKGGDFCLRLRGNAFHLYDENGEKIELADLLRDMPETANNRWALFYKFNNEQKPVVICAYRKESGKHESSLRKIKKSNNKKMRGKVSETQAFYSQFVVVATSLDEDAERIMSLYRMRWQIELLFKRLKSIFGYDDMPSKKDNTVKAWFYGKLLLAAVCETLVNQGRFSPTEQAFDQ